MPHTERYDIGACFFLFFFQTYAALAGNRTQSVMTEGLVFFFSFSKRMLHCSHVAGEKSTASDTFILYFAQGRPQIWPELAGDTPHTVILHRGMLIFSKRPLRWPGIERGPPAWQARILRLNHQCLLSAGIWLPTCSKLPNGRREFCRITNSAGFLTYLRSQLVSHSQLGQWMY